MGVQYFQRIWYCLRAHQQEWYQLLPITYPPYSLQLLTIFANFSFCLCLCHQQSTTTPWLGRAYDFVWSNPTTTNPHAAANLYTQTPCFRRCNHCTRLSASDEDLVLPGEILTTAGGRLIFRGRSSEVDADGSHLPFAVSHPIPSVYLQPLLQGL